MKVSQEFYKYTSKHLPQIKAPSIEAVLHLHEEGATVPFMARYRKERTGNLNEFQIRDILNAYEKWKTVSQRKAFVLEEIKKQGALTEDLKKQIEESDDLAVIEELYRPFKKKKKTKAKIAKDAGLQPLADWIWNLGREAAAGQVDLAVKAKEYVNPQAGFVTYAEVLRGAQHILIERLNYNTELRKKVRETFFKEAKVVSKKTTKFKPHSKYEMYADFSESVQSLQQPKASHRYLALRRGWQEGELKVTLEVDETPLLKAFEKAACPNEKSPARDFLLETAKMALTIHVIPSVSNELHRFLKEKADEAAVKVFADNLRRVLMASPFGAKVVLGVDPGLRTGCKVALVDKNGQFISHTVLHILGEKAEEKGKKLFEEVFKQIHIDAIAVGNGTGGREAERFIRKILKDLGKEDVPVIMVNEAGASVYSASEVAAKEFPDLDVTVRGAISICRRLQDPLAELVKIDPKSIGVGQYQHDVSQSLLKKSLHAVVESCVNSVGVDVNTASEELLRYVSGIGPQLAKNIVAYRKKKGLFQDRQELLSVPQLSSKSFEQAAGFLRIPGGKVPLDATGIHPERYAAVKDLLQEAGVSLGEVLGKDVSPLRPLRKKWANLIGEYTFDDILKELKRPGRDPRDPFKVFKFREDIHDIEDLKEGMICPGIVTNVTNFGAFVDIGVHQDGLVHVSEMKHKFVREPQLIFHPGDVVKVKVIKVDKDKKQISLSTILDQKKTGSSVSVRSKKKVAAKPKKPSGKKSSPKSKRRPQSKPFNNPFEVLAQIKK
ncbi:MAG: RNA-binding transcriptional accessory protein [Bdellovibrio sp.]|nr:MAG: RNA-binding transcriptional accessory protein [Bdellovibrio sp.]